MTISSLVAHTSAAYLFTAGAFMLFAADHVLPAIVPEFPRSGHFIGQLVASGWFAMATVTWSHRTKMLGGIYGRQVVSGNALLFLISAIGLLQAANKPGASGWLWIAGVPAGMFALIFVLLMFRGPFDKLTSTS